MLDRIEYRRCESGEDLEAIYRLRYKAYRAHGYVPHSASQMTSDKYDDTPNSYRFGVFIDDDLISTVRIHHVSRDQPEAPIMGAFGDIMGPRLDRGETFTNPTMLAADPDCAHGVRAIPYITLRLAVIANEHFETTGCVCVIREEHTAFYRRIFGAVQVGEPRAYPPITIPLMLYDSECAINMQKTLDRFPFFMSKPSEQRMLFDRPDTGDLAPLTILPTAKYLQHAA
ncbi:N-acyl amino acid synthase FeeM domain-containing protein [Mesorhizobium xinjiangense]|uniref:N-acyl amino acid synthase FeeM domain-containing protein n=1 Tax=Mesorhizobium xinjiangense TaxID=2678685 RepID=UPI001F2921CB|nr:hypothetical protein [Mesorhizobium xinjiangense]